MNHDPFPSPPLSSADRVLGAACGRLQRVAEAALASGAGRDMERPAGLLLEEIGALFLAHHRVEESELFPALLEAMAGSDPVCLRELAEALTDEHRAFEASWRQLRQSANLEWDALRSFAAAYLRHIQREDEELFPMAERLLAEDDLARIAGWLQPLQDSG